MPPTEPSMDEVLSECSKIIEGFSEIERRLVQNIWSACHAGDWMPRDLQLELLGRCMDRYRAEVMLVVYATLAPALKLNVANETEMRKLMSHIATVGVDTFNDRAKRIELLSASLTTAKELAQQEKGKSNAVDRS